MRDITKAGDVILLLNYIFFEYTRNDLAYIMQNLEVIDEEQDDEVVLHGNARSLIIDLTDFTTIYICSFSDYQSFEESLPFSATNRSFVKFLKSSELEFFKIDRQSFLQVLQDWHTILDARPQFVILYQNKDNHIALKQCATRESADRFIADHTK